MKGFQISRIRIFFFLSVVLFFGFLLIVILFSSAGRIKQPLAFNHKIHAENGLECVDCHFYFEVQATSGRPAIEVCSGCHEEPLGESKEEEKLMEYINAGKEIDWQRLYSVPEDVYFSHQRHVVLGELDCKLCHGSIGESLQPPSKPRKITMKMCMKCHEEREVNNDCISCHR